MLDSSDCRLNEILRICDKYQPKLHVLAETGNYELKNNQPIGEVKQLTLACNYKTLTSSHFYNMSRQYSIIDFNEVDMRIYLPEKVIIHRGR